MKIKSHYVLVLAILAAFLVSTAIFAQGWVPTAKKLFENDEYKKVIELLEKGAKDNFAIMFLAFSHLQENVFSKTKWDAEKYKNYKYQLEAKLNVNDINNLLYFVNLNDKPHVVKEARKLVKKTFDSVQAIEDVPKLLAFLNSTDKESRKLALAQIKEILEPKRKYVNEGGTMRAQDVQVMNSKTLITALLENVSESDAKKSLEIIEEPSLQYTPSYPGIETTKLEGSINGLMAKRKKKFPDSNWYSATGKTR
jgi:hypothetical protein